MHGARDVGIVVEVMIFDRLDDHAGLLGAVGTVEIDQGPAADGPFQDRKITADGLDVECDRLLGQRQTPYCDFGDICGGRVLWPTINRHDCYSAPAAAAART